MNDVDVISRILIDQFEAGNVHARVVAKEIVDNLFGLGASSSDEDDREPIARTADDGRRLCVECGQSLPEFGGIVYDDERNEIRFNRKVVRCLTGQEGAMFRMLLSARGRVLSKEKLLMDLYSRKFYADDELPEIKIIDVFICKLRKKLAPIGIDVGTSWGRGYFLIEPGQEKAA